MKPAALLGFPTNNLLAMMGGDPSKVLRVKGTTDGQETDYTVRVGRDSLSIQGKYAGEAVDVVGSQLSPRSLQFKSQSGVEVNEVFRVQPGGFTMAGKVDGKEFEETLTLNPLGALDGNILTIEGQVAGVLFTHTLKALNQLQGSLEGKFGDELTKVDLAAVKSNPDPEAAPEKVTYSGQYGDVKLQEEATQEDPAAQSKAAA